MGSFRALGVHGVGGVMVSIVAFQAVDPGSIPGRRRILFFDYVDEVGRIGATLKQISTCNSW